MNIKKQTFNSDMEIKPGEIYDLCTFMRNVTQSGGEIRSSEIRGNFKTKNAEKINDNEVFGKIIIAENDCSSNSTQPIHTLNIGEVNGSVNICSEYTTVVTGNNNNVNSISF